MGRVGSGQGIWTHFHLWYQREAVFQRLNGHTQVQLVDCNRLRVPLYCPNSLPYMDLFPAAEAGWAGQHQSQPLIFT